MHGPTPRALLPSNSHRLGSGSAHADGRASASVPRPLPLHHRAPHAGLAPVALCRWRERGLCFHVANCCLSREKEKQGVVGDSEMSEHPEQSSTVALSCQGPVAQSPISKLSGLMSVLSLVVHKAGCSQRLEGLSPPQAAGKEPTLGASLVSAARSPASVSVAGGEGPWALPSVVPCMPGASGLARDAQDGSLLNWMLRTVRLARVWFISSC